MNVEVKCRDCGRGLPAGDLNPARGLAKCLGCDEVFFYAGPLAGAEEPERLPIPIPVGYKVYRDSDFMLITLHKPGWQSYLFLAISLICSGVVLLGPAGAIVASFQSGSVPGWGLLASAAVMGLLGLLSLYRALVEAFNSTLLRVGRDQLSLTRGPLPVPGNQQLLSVMIQQLYVREKVRRRVYVRDGDRYERFEISYQLLVRLKDGNEVVLIEMPSTEQAEFLELQVEYYLGIKDRPMAGETAKRLF